MENHIPLGSEKMKATNTMLSNFWAGNTRLRLTGHWLLVPSSAYWADQRNIISPPATPQLTSKSKMGKSARRLSPLVSAWTGGCAPALPHPRANLLGRSDDHFLAMWKGLQRSSPLLSSWWSYSRAVFFPQEHSRASLNLILSVLNETTAGLDLRSSRSAWKSDKILSRKNLAGREGIQKQQKCLGCLIWQTGCNPGKLQRSRGYGNCSAFIDNVTLCWKKKPHPFQYYF